MDPETNGTFRLTRQQIVNLSKAIGRKPDTEEVELARTPDGRLIVREVVKVERLKAFKIN